MPVSPDFWPQAAANHAAVPQTPPPAASSTIAPAQVAPAAPQAVPPSDVTSSIAAIRAMASAGMTAVQISQAVPTFTPEAVTAVLGLPV
jgi:hypothetical protein